MNAPDAPLEPWQPKSRRRPAEGAAPAPAGRRKGQSPEQAVLQQAKPLLRRRRYADALALYLPLCDRDPPVPRAFIGAGIVHLRQQRRDEALRCFTRAVELAPQLARAQFWRGETYRLQGDLAAAQAALEQAIALSPQRAAKSWISLSRVRLRQQQPDGAVTALEQALSLNPGAMAVRRQLAQLLVKCGRLDDAAAVLDRGLRYEPQDGATVALRVAVAQQQQQPDVAAALMNRTLAALGDAPQARLPLARQLARHGLVALVDTAIAPLLNGKTAPKAQLVQIDARCAANDGAAAQALWQQLPRNLQQRPPGQRRQAAYLAALGHEGEAMATLTALLQRLNAATPTADETPPAPAKSLSHLEKAVKQALKRQRQARR